MWVIDAPDSKVQGANMGPIWGRQDPDVPHVGPMNFAIWGLLHMTLMWSLGGLGRKYNILILVIIITLRFALFIYAFHIWFQIMFIWI